MELMKVLLEHNRQWAAKKQEGDPEFFHRLASQHTPQFLWIGCSDARVSASDLLNLDPGTVFVHRNIANQVHQIDFNGRSVLQYAIEGLKVENIIVCGHYGCGGIRAALARQPFDILDSWLQPVRDIQSAHREELEALPDEAARTNRLAELNVRYQVVNVCRTRVVQDAWRKGRTLAVHGVIYSIADGLLRDLDMSVQSDADLDPAYQFMRLEDDQQGR